MAPAKPVEDKLFVCPSCQRGNFKSLYAVRVHFEAKGHPIRCEPCGQSFDSVSGLLLHSQTHQKAVESTSKRPQKQAKGQDNPKPLFSTPVDPFPGPSSQAQPSKNEKRGKQTKADLIDKSSYKKAPKFVQGPELSTGFVGLTPMPTSKATVPELSTGFVKITPIPRRENEKPVEPIPKSTIPPAQPRGEKSKHGRRENEKAIGSSSKSTSPPAQIKGGERKVAPRENAKAVESKSKSSLPPAQTQREEPKQARREKGKDRQKPVKAVETLGGKRSQSPLRSVFGGNQSSGANPSFGFGDSLLGDTGREASSNLPPVSQNENYHVTLEPLEQNLIFRYLSARCHSDARLFKHGFTFQMPVREGSKRPIKSGPIPRELFREVPQFSSGNSKRRAIVLDCEMVRVEGGRQEVAFLSAIDFLTGEVLIDNYVEPRARVTNWDARYSGVTAHAMSKAVKKGTALRGWPAARAKLWEFMNFDTVLIGHSLNNDLDVLGMIHWNIVDSSILTGEAVFLHLKSGEQIPRTWSLKTLANELVNYNIQAGKKGHSALEDAHATRDVVIWCIRYPELLKVWAENAREEVAMRAHELEMKQIDEREQYENQRQLEMESRVKALSHGLGGLAVTSESDDESDAPVSVVETVTVQQVEYF